MNAELLQSRRAKLGTLCKENEAVIVFANAAGKLIKFTQDNNFLYLTGLMTPEAILMMIRRGDNVIETLFIERGIPEQEVWDGKKMTVTEAQELSGIKNVKYLDEFISELGMNAMMIGKVWANLGLQALDRPLSLPMFCLQPLKERFPHIELCELAHLIAPMRKIKDDWEIQQLQKAIDITGKGIMDVFEQAKVMMYEYELEAMLFYRMQRSGIKNWGFAPIIAAGVNAATLHYEKNECQIESGQLVLMDVGASYNNYSADITRCFPIGDKFSERQAQIYQIVLDVQKEIISMIKPGVKLSELNIRTRELLTESALAIGLIDDPSGIIKHYMHSVSHFLGMDTHDLGGREAILEVGNVITVEPGLYIEAEKLGVRIEDDVLVTEEGNCVLSQNIPKEIAEIEEIRRQAMS